LGRFFPLLVGSGIVAAGIVPNPQIYEMLKCMKMKFIYRYLILLSAGYTFIFNLFLFCINAFLVFVFVNNTKDDKTKLQKYRHTDHHKFIPYLIKKKL